ncbi:hypothetical protein [Phyllobacterium myrsinacearum]|uniref:Uncharacterized protein n=1 Tax=Phyllobacterium myrsinacearum TaxID=28101 RepID=A0A839EU78_9HYPH|nr:hypothetical protein [Phyllobacterium myrsinacearum]MBA8881738.1 hypothetical protein [Phyllobacterium myrsinacearum]
MAPRIILGDAGAGQIFRISRPGKNVLNASQDDLMFDGYNPMLQMVHRGVVRIPVAKGSYVEVNTIDQGYWPLIHLAGGWAYTVGIHYLSNSTFRIGYFDDSFVSGSPVAVSYIVTNQRFG